MPVQILVVEDEAVTAVSLKTLIEKSGWECLSICGDAESALAAVSRTMPDIVLMDINLGGMIDGIDAAEILRSRFGLHVIYITAYSNPEIVDRIHASEPYGYVLKPF
ncbi:MAG: response regulator, partial [Spirochaetota bacterium]